MRGRRTSRGVNGIEIEALKGRQTPAQGEQKLRALGKKRVIPKPLKGVILKPRVSTACAALGYEESSMVCHRKDFSFCALFGKRMGVVRR